MDSETTGYTLCEDCGGSGKKDDGTPCPSCEGTGLVKVVIPSEVRKS